MQVEDRVVLPAMRMLGMSLLAIGTALGRCASTMSRELQRNSICDFCVCRSAQSSCQSRLAKARCARKLDPGAQTWSFVLHMLGWL
jgi:IS30 family transposase